MLFEKKVVAAYKARLFVRCDDRGFIRYFSAADFPGLRAEPYSFPSSHGHSLKGWFYSYPGFDPKRLVVFEHGIGGGHRSYMKEIEQLCRQGFRVFAYDHTGCMESGGKDTGGFSQSLCDLDDCLKALKSDESLDTNHISLVGHSGGGFAVMNASALHPDIKRIVSISGYISVERMVEQYIPCAYRKAIMELEAAGNPEYVKYNAVDTLRNTKARVLLIHSDNDSTVKKELHFDELKKALEGRENLELLLTPGKGHNPNYTTAAVKLLSEMTSALKKSPPKTEEEKERFKSSFDWDKMTEQDEAVWERINQFLK